MNEPLAIAVEHHATAAGSPPLWTIAPFALYLFLIAVIPLVAGSFWAKNRNKLIVAAILSVPVVLYLALGNPHGLSWLAESVKEYVAFMTLLLALFVITGGIYLARRARRYAGHQHRLPRLRRADRQSDRHHRRIVAADPALAARQREAHAPGAHGGLLHLHRLERRRDADAARRSAAVSGIPARRALLLGAAPVRTLGDGQRPAAGDLLRCRQRDPQTRGAAPAPRRASTRRSTNPTSRCASSGD